jgi:muramoyltetrapeptide carboxypeptidase
MLKPRALAPGDRLALVAPASPFDRNEFNCGIEEIRRLGFVPVYDDSVFARESYVAGPPELRATAIRAAWRDPAIAGIIGVRGGYGSAQLLPLLDPAEARAARKVFIGYSDLTALLTFHSIAYDMVAFHGPMLAGRWPEAWLRSRFVPTRSARTDGGAVGGRRRVGSRRRSGGAAAHGTLTQLLASLGTPFAFNPPQGHVLFLDESRRASYAWIEWSPASPDRCWPARARSPRELPWCDEPVGSRRPGPSC